MEQMAGGNFNVKPEQAFIGDFKNIENSITNFIVNMSGTLRSIQESCDTVDSAAGHVSSSSQALADDTAKALENVVAGAQAITELIGKISSASSEQAVSSNQIVAGIDPIAAVIQTNSATAEESAAASEELSGQAQVLKNLVNKFTPANTVLPH